MFCYFNGQLNGVWSSECSKFPWKERNLVVVWCSNSCKAFIKYLPFKEGFLLKVSNGNAEHGNLSHTM